MDILYGIYGPHSLEKAMEIVARASSGDADHSTHLVVGDNVKIVVDLFTNRLNNLERGWGDALSGCIVTTYETMRDALGPVLSLRGRMFETFAEDAQAHQ